MLHDAAEAHRVVRDTFEEASEALGYDLWTLVSEDPHDQLNLTEYTQPALLAASVALWRAWAEAGGPAPDLVAGHSLGELSALCCAGFFPLPEAVVAVRARGQAMQTAVPVGEGAMAAILGLEDSVILEYCEGRSRPGAIVEAVNFNAPGQVVIAGHATAVESATADLKEAGAKRAMALPVSAPFHTSLMKPAGEHLDGVLKQFRLHAPAIPVVHNVHAATEEKAAAVHRLLVEQVSAPVRWTSCIETMKEAGVTRFVECGPGKVLGGLLRRIDRDLTCHYIEDPDGLDAALAALS